MNRKRKVIVVALFISTLLIGGVAIFIGYRLSQQGTAPDDVAAAIGDTCIDPTPPWNETNKSTGSLCCGGGTEECASSFCAADFGSSQAAQTGIQGVCQPFGGCGVLCNGGPDGEFPFQTCPDSFCADGLAGGCTEAAINLGCYRTGSGGGGNPTCASGNYSHYACANQFPGEGGLPGDFDCRDFARSVNSFDDFYSPYCGTQQIDCNEAGPNPIFVGKIDRTGCNVTPTPTVTGTVTITQPGGGGGTSTPTPTPIPFDIQILAFCQDSTGPRYLVGGAPLVIGQGSGTAALNTTTNDNGAYTTTKYRNGPFVGHVRIGGTGTITLKNVSTGAIERTVDISALSKTTPVTGNSTGLAPQCTTSGGTNTAGQCDCAGQYEVCNFNEAGANSNDRFYFEFKFTNCLASITTTPTSTPSPTPTGTITVTPTASVTPTTPPVPQCGDSCSAAADNCAPGTGCYDTGGGVYRCALDQCIANPSLCNPDLCSFADAVNVNKTAVMTCINGGDTAQVDYSVIISNTLSNSRTINVSDDLDSKVQNSYVQNSSITLGGIHSNGIINWTNLNLPGSSTGTTLTLNYRLLIPQSAFGTYTNTVTVNEGGTIRGTDTVAIDVNCLPGTALISDKADRIVLAVIMITMGIAIFRFGWHRDIGNWAWYRLGEPTLTKISPSYRKQKFERNLAKGAKKTKTHRKK